MYRDILKILQNAPDLLALMYEYFMLSTHFFLPGLPP